MTARPLRRLILNDALQHGLWAVRGDSPAFWVLNWRGSLHEPSFAVRIRGVGGNVGCDDNKWFHLLRLSARNPDDPSDNRWWEIRVGWRHRWELPLEGGWYDQTACTAIEPVTADQVEEWLMAAKSAPRRTISPQMDPVEQLDPAPRRLLGLDGPTSPDPEDPRWPDGHES